MTLSNNAILKGFIFLASFSFFLGCDKGVSSRYEIRARSDLNKAITFLHLRTDIADIPRVIQDGVEYSGEDLRNRLGVDEIEIPKDLFGKDYNFTKTNKVWKGVAPGVDGVNNDGRGDDVVVIIDFGNRTYH